MEEWRKRVGVEPTTRASLDRIAGFEGREGHRTPYASAVATLARQERQAGAPAGEPQAGSE